MKSKIKKFVTIRLEGDDESDIELAFNEAVRLISEGNTSGFDKDDSGSFIFNIIDLSNPQTAL